MRVVPVRMRCWRGCSSARACWGSWAAFSAPFLPIPRTLLGEGHRHHEAHPLEPEVFKKKGRPLRTIAIVVATDDLDCIEASRPVDEMPREVDGCPSSAIFRRDIQ